MRNLLNASVFIIACSARNRLRRWFRRLREPRYLLGAIAGIVYLYFSFYTRMRASRIGTGRRRPPGRPPAEILAVVASVVPPLAAIGLLAAAALAWVFPIDSGLLEFSRAEVQLLFPAPLTRRQLVVYRLVR